MSSWRRSVVDRARTASSRTGQELIDACAKVRGLLTDEEVTRLFSPHSHSAARSILNERLPAGYQHPSEMILLAAISEYCAPVRHL